MGFLSGFVKGLTDEDIAGVKEVLDMYDEEDEDNAVYKHPNYRKTGLENTESNYGWYKCIKCGKNYRKGDMDIDHIIPKSKGGDNSKYNLQCICKHCNRSKQADTTDTRKDLDRRRKELEKQREEDAKFLYGAVKHMKKKK